MVKNDEFQIKIRSKFNVNFDFLLYVHFSVHLFYLDIILPTFSVKF